MKKIKQIGINSRKALIELSKMSSKKINKVLSDYNHLLLKNKKIILKENQKDLKSVKRKHFTDRLMLNEKRIDGIRESINQIIKFKSPLNKVLEEWKRTKGHEVGSCVREV